MTEKDKNRILAELQLGRNPYTIARRLNVKPSDVRRVMRETDLPALPTWGRASIQQYIVSRRHCSRAYWPAEDQQLLLEMRRQHDQGRVTMCQGRDGEWVIQYAIQMRRPLRRNPYFFGG